MFSNSYSGSILKGITFVALSSGIGFSQAHAAIFTPVERNSVISALACTAGWCNNGFNSAPTVTSVQTRTDFGVFNQSVNILPGQELAATASQNSSIGSDGFSVSMVTTAGFAGHGAYSYSKGQSIFELTFSIDEAMQYDFLANIPRNTSPGCDPSTTFPRGVSISLTGAGGSVLPGVACGHDVSMEQSGILEAGTYTFVMSMLSQDWYDFNADASLKLTAISQSPVPLPAAAWLMGSGLLGLAGLARRRGS